MSEARHDQLGEGDCMMKEKRWLPSLQGRYVATDEFSWGLAGALGPTLFGITFDFSPAAPWLVMGVVVLGAIALLRAAEAGLTGAANRAVRVEHAE